MQEVTAAGVVTLAGRRVTVDLYDALAGGPICAPGECGLSRLFRLADYLGKIIWEVYYGYGLVRQTQ
jgi:hypothetical protein